MIYISELLELKLFDDFKLIAGKNGINNQINNIVILEYESIKNTYNVFSKGDFVLSSLFFAKDDKTLIEEAFINLMQRGVSAIAIKTVFFNDIPSSLKDMADKFNVPIFIFSNAYMEDLIICANELLKSKLLYIVLEEKITKLIENKLSKEKILDTTHSINPGFYPKIITAYFTSKNHNESDKLIKHFERLLYSRYKSQNNMHYSYVKYHEGMMLIYSFDTLEKNLIDTVYKLIKLIDLIPEKYYIGISDTIYTQDKLNLSMKEAIYSNRICQLKDCSYITYSNIGIYKMIVPMLDNEIVIKNCHNQIKILNDYDSKFTSNILDTLIIFVHNRCEIASTAKELFQHPNTIRYRIKKACNLLSIDEVYCYNYIFMLITLYLIDKNTTI